MAKNWAGILWADADVIEPFAGTNSAGMGETDCCVGTIDRAADILSTARG
jgi:hypothetical protein